MQLKQRMPIAPTLVTPLLMLICYLFSQFGFSSLLGVFYPIFGALALVWVIMLLRAPTSPPPRTAEPPSPENKGITIVAVKPVIRIRK
ncbi:hypothetical protein D3C71_2049700 [compost metagenome]